MSANYLAREVAFDLGAEVAEGWGVGDRAIQEYFSPVETFAERFDDLIRNVHELGFDGIDLYTAHLHPAWATDSHVEAAVRSLRRHGIRVCSIGPGDSQTLAGLEDLCRLGRRVGADTVISALPTREDERSQWAALLRDYGLRLAIENHPEPTPAEIRSMIDDTDTDVIGTAVDTGWYATQGYS
jgi:sugar phosphate isomerase/epimerase